MKPTLFPAFVKLAGRACVVIGAGSVAESKIASLLDAGGQVTVVAPHAKEEIKGLAASRRIRWIPRKFKAGDLNRVFLVVAATSDPEVNRAVFHEARERGVLCNSVDDPPNCDFYFPAVVRRGPLHIAISTSGESPALAQRIRREIEDSLDTSFGEWVEEIGERRREIIDALPPSEGRKRLLHRLAHSEPAPRVSAMIIAGIVYFVGAGPGDPELLTLKAHALLRRADVVLHDDLVTPEIIAIAQKTAQIVNVGKRCGKKDITQAQINHLMIDAALHGLAVVRLKSGDPGVFGRLAEEISALEASDIPYEIVPGVTTGIAAAASIGASLTDRRSSSRVVFLTRHHATEKANNAQDWAAIARADTTLVVYMPGRDLVALRSELLDAGLSPDCPAVIVSRVSSPYQQEWVTTISALDQAPELDSPSILLLGRTLAPVRPDFRRVPSYTLARFHD